MPLGISSPVLASCCRWCVAAVFLLVVLQWTEPETRGGAASTPLLIKLAALSPDRGKVVAVLHLSSHRGDGVDGEHRSAEAFCRSAERLPKRCYDDELNHAGGKLATAIFCRHGGESLTSDEEALLRIRHWSSTLLRHQVVRPRWQGGGQWTRFFAGRGRSSTLPLILGGDALRTPATCGGDTQELDCFFFFSVRVFFVIIEALSSNFKFLVRVLSKGLLCKMYLPRLDE